MSVKSNLGGGLNAILKPQNNQNNVIKSESQNNIKSDNHNNVLSEKQETIKTSNPKKPKKIGVKDKERITTYLEKDLFKKFKKYCLDKDLNLNEGFNELIRQGMSK